MKARTILSAPILLLLLCAIAVPARAQAADLRTVPFVSYWNDYKTSVPEGWNVSSDFEGTWYTDTTFKNRETYSLSIRWYTRYSTHRLPSGSLEMYSGVEDYVKQTFQRDGNPLDETAIRDVTVGPSPEPRRGITGNPKAFATHSTGRESAYTIVSMPSGFYVLMYSAPQAGYSTHENLYNTMVASFTPLKDRPGGAALPGIVPEVATPAQQLQRYLSSIKSHRDKELSEPVCEQTYDTNDRGDLVGPSYTKCHCWFTDPDGRKQIIQLVATMQPPPAIPEDATRYFVEGNVFYRAAKNAADYRLAISKYKAALLEAPWWGAAYNNLGIALNAAECREDAKLAVQLYLLTKPEDASNAQRKIYEIGANEQLQQEHRRRCAEFEREVNQGNEDCRNGRYDAAIEHAKKGLEACPEHPEAHTAYCNLAIAYVQGNRDYDQGLKYAQKGLELKPDDLSCNGIMAMVLWGRGDHSGACRHWQRACQLGGPNSCQNYRSSCP